MKATYIAILSALQRVTDGIRELRITYEMHAGLAASSPIKARNHFTRMARLISKRSRGKVERMDRKA